MSSCGCSRAVQISAAQRGTSCCNRAIQAAPVACCESNSIVKVPGVCFYPTCNVAAQYPDPFFIAFQNQCGAEVPISLGNVFFFDQAAGFLNIHLYDNATGAYQVSLVDPTRVGAVIRSDSCVLVSTSASVTGVVGSQRCLSGQFVAPDEGEPGASIVIYNGSGIQIGSTITFTNAGTQGSYTVAEYISASGLLYAYRVVNGGSGFTPGTIVNAGPDGACEIPIEIVTAIDLCDLSETSEIDALSGCLNGVPRALTPIDDDFTIVGEGDKWVQKRATNLDCCVFSVGCIKFSGDACTEAQDTVEVGLVGVECFTEAYIRASAGGSVVTGLIGSLPVIITSWNENTRIIVLKPAVDDYLPVGEEMLEFCDPGTAICLGDCCRQCTNGPQTTDIFVADASEHDTTFIVGPVTLAYNAAASAEYLVGYAFDTGAVTSLLINSTYNDVAGRPTVADPMVIRQKICNTHPLGCTQDAQLEYNYELKVGGLPLASQLIMHWEMGSFVFSSQTLEDNTTPNPFFNTASQASAAGQMVGIEITSSNISNTNIGFGGPADSKMFPYTAGFFKDHAQLPDCNCATAIVWFYVLLSPQNTIIPGNVTVTLAIRRYITKTLTNDIVLPDNDPDAQGWN